MIPKTVIWFKLSAALLCLIYAGATVWLYHLLGSAEEIEMSVAMLYTLRVAIVLLGLALTTLSSIALLPVRHRWMWSYGLIIICLGMSTGVLLPVCAPLLIYWFRPNVKRYYKCIIEEQDE